MRFGKFKKLAFELWRSGDPTALLVLGPPGTGKSAAAQAIGELMTEHVTSRSPAAPEALIEVIDLSSRLPEDIGGLPYRGEVNGIPTTFYAGQSWVSRLCDPDAYGVLCLDDLPAAVGSVQVAVRQLVLDRKVGEHRISDGVLIIVTGNRREDKSAAKTLPAHFRNSVCSVTIEPSLDDWAAWYGQQPGHEPVVSSFLRHKPLHLSQLPKDAGANGAFATPRTWAKLGRMWETAKECGALLDVAMGLVGEGPATEIIAWDNLRHSLVDPEAVLKDPAKALPGKEAARIMGKPDTATALAHGLGERAASWSTGDDAKLRRTAAERFLEAMAYTTKEGGREYAVVAVDTFVSNGGDMNSMVRCITRLKRSGKMSDELSAFLDFVIKNIA